MILNFQSPPVQVLHKSLLHLPLFRLWEAVLCFFMGFGTYLGEEHSSFLFKIWAFRSRTHACMDSAPGKWKLEDLCGRDLVV
jgi:hypothetical protein